MYDDGPLSTRQQLDALKLERERAKLLADQAKAQQQVNKVALDARQSFAKQDPRRVDVPPVQLEVPAPTRSLTNAERAARESSNNPEAINLKSTAGGLYQMTEAARADARKANPALRDLDYYPLKDSNGNVDPAQMQRSIEAQNSYKDAYEGVIQKQLTSLGVPAEAIDQNAINQAWVVGPTGYRNILNAEPGTPLENILSKEAIAKNPNLQNKTAGSFLSDPDPYSRVETKGAGVPTLDAETKSLLTRYPAPTVPIMGYDDESSLKASVLGAETGSPFSEYPTSSSTIMDYSDESSLKVQQAPLGSVRLDNAANDPRRTDAGKRLDNAANDPRRTDYVPPGIRLDNAANDPRRTDYVPIDYRTAVVVPKVEDPRTIGFRRPDPKAPSIYASKEEWEEYRKQKAIEDADLARGLFANQDERRTDLKPPFVETPIPRKKPVDSRPIANVEVPVQAGIIPYEPTNEFANVLEGETKQRRLSTDESLAAINERISKLDPNNPLDFKTIKELEAQKEILSKEALARGEPPRPEPELSDENKAKFDELGRLGSQVEADALNTSLNDTDYPAYNIDKDKLKAIMEGKSDSKTEAEVKSKISPTFWERLSESFGDLFTDKEFIKFGILLAGGLLSGGSFGGSLKYAGLYALQSADKREAAKAIEDKEIKKKLIDEGYSVESIDKYLKSKDASDLGSRPNKSVNIGNSKLMTFTGSVSYNGKVYKEGDPIYTYQTKVTSGPLKGQVVEMARIGNQEIPLDALQKSGGLLTAWDSSKYGSEAIVKRSQDFIDNATKTAAAIINSNYSEKDLKGGKGLMTAEAIADDTKAWFDKKGFATNNIKQQPDIRKAMRIATEKLIEDQKAGVKVKSFDSYLDSSFIKVRSEISDDLFMLGDNKQMKPTAIVSLKDTLRSTTNNKTDVEAYEELNRLAKVWTDNANNLQNKYKSGDVQSGFAQFVEDIARAKKPNQK